MANPGWIPKAAANNKITTIGRHMQWYYISAIRIYSKRKRHVFADDRDSKRRHIFPRNGLARPLTDYGDYYTCARIIM